MVKSPLLNVVSCNWRDLSLFALRFDSEQITILLFNLLQVANFTARPRSIFVISWIYGIRQIGIREIGNKQGV